MQLAHIVDPKFLFQNNYSYVSSTSAVFVKHLADYSNHVTDFLGLSNDSFVVDIGSNDGACLKGFKKKGMSVLGVDPAHAQAVWPQRHGRARGGAVRLLTRAQDAAPDADRRASARGRDLDAVRGV